MAGVIEGGITVSPRELKELLMMALKNFFNVIVSGPPGVGKSAIVKQAADDLGYDLLLCHPAVKDPTDFNGFPFPVERNGRKIADFLIFGDMLKIVEAVRPLAVCFEDMIQAAPSVQAPIMQVIWERELNGIKIPDHVAFITTTNRRQDKAGGQGLIEPFKSRNAIYNLRPDIKDWVEWAYKDNQPAMLIAFCRRNSKALFEFAPTMDIVNTPCPRTVAKLGHWINAGVPNDLKMQVYSSCCGEGFSQEFIQFERLVDKLEDPDYIISNPMDARIYTKKDLDLTYVTVTSLALRATKQNFDNIMKYGGRLDQEYTMLLVTDSISRNKELMQTKAFSKWAEKNGDILF